MGCDFFKFINIIDDFLFQSTHPSWGATNRFKHILPFETISIHAPIVGCDFESPREKTRYLISIHAPIVGCDNLYSSSPIFQIIFQSTHPSWGATKNVLRYSFTNNNFNPRTHRGVRPLMLRIFLGLNRISIHAPIVGCDADTLLILTVILIFQSTHPSWGATTLWKLSVGNFSQFQSTHPSWGATFATAFCAFSSLFQSTHPSWGATNYSRLFTPY